MRRKSIINALENWNGMSCYGFTSRNFQHSKSSLSEILQDNVDKNYYLSEKACLGILRRASERNKELPAVLKKALEQQAGISACATKEENG